MMKWSPKIYMEHITQKKDPLGNIGEGGQTGLSPIAQTLKGIGSKLGMLKKR